jgi:tetratricopeptide (TPR) repeat protein
MIHALVASVAMAALSLPLGGTVHRKTEEANGKYTEKAYDDALRGYTEAQVGAPEAPELHYDIGNVLYRQENWQGAAEEYSRALLSAAPTLSPSVSYNLGNALFKQEKFDDAAKAYRRTLEAIPGDRDAKRNLELSLRAVEQKQQQQKDPQQKQDKEEEQKEKQQQKQQPAPGGDQKKNEEEKKAPGESKPEPGDDRKQGGKDKKREGGMTPEEAKSLLDSLGEQEKAALKKQAERRAKQEDSGPEEDW